MTDIPEGLRDDWRQKLLLTPTHMPKASIANALIALREAPEWRGVLAYDAFALVTMSVRRPPWAQGANSWTPCRWTDGDDVLATEWLHLQRIGVQTGDTAKAVEAVAHEAPFHPVRDYLEGLRWDGVKRVSRFAANYLGAEPTAYHANVGQCILIAAVARIMQPGCKADHVPIFEGPQGTLKSTAIERMFTPWFTDDIAELGTKDAAMQMNGVWGVEIAELSSMTRGEVERVKAFVTRRTDRFRPSYGRRVIEADRQCVFIGSTNAEVYLKDDSGARRFWPIRCGRIDIAAIERDRDQLWAEAVNLYRKGVRWWLTNGQDVEAAQEEQADRYANDVWFDDIANYVEDKEDVTVPEILRRVIEKPQERWTRGDEMRIAACLQSLGFKRARRPRPGRKWHYARVVPT